jgi:uncharacterized protein (DUF1501 family)
MMLDHDISTRDAKRLLSAADLDLDRPGPRGWTRRKFLGAVGAGAFAGASIGQIAADFFGGSIPEAWAGTPIGGHDGILVVITMYGGNDGLNTLVPYSNGLYQSLRSNIAYSANRVLKLDDHVGLHPELTYLKQLWDAGQVAALQGVGYSNPDLSHFSSMALWMNGTFAGGPLTSGWLGRWLDGQPSSVADLAAVSIDNSVPLHMLGNVRRAVAVSEYGEMFGTGNDPGDVRLYQGIRGIAATPTGQTLRDLYATTMKRQVDLAADVAPVFATDLPGGDLTRRLTVAARMINANIGLRVIDAGFGGFDNHQNEQNDHPGLMRDLNTALQSFYATLKPEFQTRVTLVTVSEFGRTPDSNDSGGTDHGTANVHFVIGTSVRGGLYGQQPSLAALDDNGRMVSTLDFRHVYGTLLDRWMGGGATDILGGAHQDLNFFAGGPGDPPPGNPTPIVVLPVTSRPSGYQPVVPLRVFDTRDGTGGRTTPLGAGETWTFAFADGVDIPGDATAAAINVTSVGATSPTFVTVFPTGDSKPFTANLNPVPGLAVPNLVISRLGTKNRLDVFNNSGSVHLVGDLVGWFRGDSDEGLVPLTPARLLDTRDSSAPLGAGQTIDLQVTGQGGVPADADAVVVNLAVTGPTAPSFLTVWPTGQSRPVAASINMVPGQTVPNMVITGVGAGGKISIYNLTGSTHVIVDVLGAFRTGASARYVAMTPTRVLDTRDGTGAPKAPLGQTPLVLQLAGKQGVPPTGISAVVMNVTAVRPTDGTYVTVYPTGGDRPLAANLNAVAGQVVPNMVLGRLGPDGAVAIFNHSGTVDLVADVMGYFTS